MLVMQTIANNEIVNKKYYKNNTPETREHYISTLKIHYRGNYKMLDLINEYKNNFISRNSIPYDDYFSFEMHDVFFEGLLLSNKFFSYNFDVNANINYTMLFPHDDLESRKIFSDEVKYYLKSNGYYSAYEQLLPLIESFKNEDNAYIYVEKQNLAMKNESDY